MGKRGTNDIAPILRAGFEKGLRSYARKRGMTIPEVFEEWIEKYPMELLRAMGRYTVREATVSGKISHDHKHSHEPVSNTSGWIEELLGGAAEGTLAQPVPARPVLPAAVRVAETGH